MMYRRPGWPAPGGGTSLGGAATAGAARKFIPAAAAAVAVEAFRKSRRETSSEARCEVLWFCGLPSSHILHIVGSSFCFPPLGLE
jgi:hypothetical protein